MKIQKRCMILFLVVVFPAFIVAQDNEDELDMSTEIPSTVKTEASSETSAETTTTQTSLETTTQLEEYDTEPPKGLLGQFLMDGPDVKLLPKNSTPEKVYTYLSVLFMNQIKKLFEQVRPDMHDYFFVLQEIVSQDCFIGLMRFLKKTEKGEHRALKMLDSSAKIIANGLTYGTYTDLGDFDQCLSKDDSVLTENDKPMNGRYCLARIKLPLPEPRPHLRFSDKMLNFTNTEQENGVNV